MYLDEDIDRGRKIAEILYRTFNTTGIFGRSDMPEDELPKGVKKGSVEHSLFITLTVAIDYMRDANQLWDAARKTYEDEETRWLFDPDKVSKADFGEVMKAMTKYRLSKMHKRDVKTWKTISTILAKEWGGDPIEILKKCDYDALKVLELFRNSYHYEGGRKVYDFPFLRGDKIGPLWLRMMRDNVGIEGIRNLDKLMPVDVHIARSTLMTGVLRGNYSGSLDSLKSEISRAWIESVRGLEIDGRKIIAIDIDEPLWHLSKYGCSGRQGKYCPKRQFCPVSKFCVDGLVRITSKGGGIYYVEVRT